MAHEVIMNLESEYTKQLRLIAPVMLGVVLAAAMLSWDQNIYSLTIAPATYAVTMGALLGSLLSVISSELLGTRVTLMVSSTLLFSSWCFIITTGFLSLAKFLGGVAIGLISVATPIYIGEVSHKSSRGTMGSLIFLMVNIGFLLMHLCQNTWSVFQNWTEGLFAILSLFSFIRLFYAPESPYFLVKKNKSAAKRTLEYLRGVDATEEFNDLVNEVGKSPVGLPICKRLGSQEAKKCLFVTACLMVTQAGCGITTVKYISTNSHVFTGDVKLYKIVYLVFLGVQVFVSMLYCRFVKDCRRRVVMLTALWVMAFCLLIIGLYFKLWWFYRVGPWFVVSLLILFLIAFNMGFGPMPWILLNEMYSRKVNSVKSLVYGVSVSLFWLFTLVWNELLREYLYSAGIHVFCWTPCIICTFAAIFIHITFFNPNVFKNHFDKKETSSLHIV